MEKYSLSVNKEDKDPLPQSSGSVKEKQTLNLINKEIKQYVRKC